MYKIIKIYLPQYLSYVWINSLLSILFDSTLLHTPSEVPYLNKCFYFYESKKRVYKIKFSVCVCVFVPIYCSFLLARENKWNKIKLLLAQQRRVEMKKIIIIWFFMSFVLCSCSVFFFLSFQGCGNGKN